MPHIIYPSAEEMPGPWWLDRKALEELDAVFETDTNGSSGIEGKSERFIEVVFDDGGRATAESFKAVLRDHSRRSRQVGVGFRARYKCGRVVAVVEARNFNKGSNPLPFHEEEGRVSLVIQVEPESSQRSRQ